MASYFNSFRTDIYSKKMNQQSTAELEKKPSRHSSSLFWPILLITIGFILLANNFDLIPWNIWDSLLHFWPIILILIGLEILLGKSRISNFIVTTIGLLVLFSILISSLPELTKMFNSLISKLSILRF